MWQEAVDVHYEVIFPYLLYLLKVITTNSATEAEEEP